MDVIGRDVIAAGSGETTMRRATGRTGRERARRESGGNHGRTSGGADTARVRLRLKTTITKGGDDAGDTENAVEHLAPRRILKAKARTNAENGATGIAASARSGPEVGTGTDIVLDETTQTANTDAVDGTPNASDQDLQRMPTGQTKRTSRLRRGQGTIIPVLKMTKGDKERTPLSRLAGESGHALAVVTKHLRRDQGAIVRNTKTMRRHLVNDRDLALLAEPLSLTPVNRHRGQRRSTTLQLSRRTPRRRPRKTLYAANLTTRSHNCVPP